jgi:hypothetical protein
MPKESAAAARGQARRRTAGEFGDIPTGHADSVAEGDVNFIRRAANGRTG